MGGCHMQPNTRKLGGVGWEQPRLVTGVKNKPVAMRCGLKKDRVNCTVAMGKRNPKKSEAGQETSIVNREEAMVIFEAPLFSLVWRVEGGGGKVAGVIPRVSVWWSLAVDATIRGRNNSSSARPNSVNRSCGISVARQ